MNGPRTDARAVLMRVALVGSAADRDRLRPMLQAAGFDIVREADDLHTPKAPGAPEAGEDAVVIAAAARRSAIPPPADQSEPLPEALTARELDVLRLLAIGLPNKRIASRLTISDQTVKFHVAAILGKLGAANRTDAVRRAARRGLIDL